MAEQQNGDDYEKKLRKRYEAAVRHMQEEQQKKELARRLLDDAAYERLMNVRNGNEELYNQVLNLLISFVQAQRLSGKITDTELLSILKKVTARHEPTISFKHK